LGNHAASCPRCQETRATTMMMKELVANNPAHRLRDYRVIWLKAQYARKEERLTKFDLLALVGLSLSGIAGLFGLFLLMLPQLSGRFLDIMVPAVPRLSTVLSSGVPVLVVTGVAVMIWILTRDSIFIEK
ncbi:MAG: hypothetical protein WBD36_06075, partial [Bacteroidota bacterium]